MQSYYIVPMYIDGLKPITFYYYYCGAESDRTLFNRVEFWCLEHRCLEFSVYLEINDDIHNDNLSPSKENAL